MMVAAGKASSFSRPARRVKARPAERIPVCVPSPAPFVEGPGPGKAWWEKALSEKSFSGPKRGNTQQNQGVGAKSRTTNLGPFGEAIRVTGAMGDINPIRFSSKYDDYESDLLYYGYRYYKPSTGAWPNRDPYAEFGFRLLTQMYLSGFGQDIVTYIDGTRRSYGFVDNDSIDAIDHLGLFSLKSCFKCLMKCKSCFSLPGLTAKCASGIGNESGNPNSGEALQLLENLKGIAAEENTIQQSDAASDYCFEHAPACVTTCYMTACEHRYALEQLSKKYKGQIEELQRLTKNIIPCLKLTKSLLKCFAK